jgi:hypothetical protein
MVIKGEIIATDVGISVDDIIYFTIVAAFHFV